MPHFRETEFQQAPFHIDDDLPAEPTLTGRVGKAWMIETDARPPASLVTWLIERPDAHPAWHSYALSVAHLRPIPGDEKPIIHLEGATHELILFALNPQHPRSLTKPAEPLFPPNFAAQIITPSDAVAVQHVDLAAQAVVDGLLNPDTDFRDQWVKRFNDSMIDKG